MSSNQSSGLSSDSEKNVIDNRGATPLSLKSDNNKENGINVECLNISDNDNTFMLHDELIELCINNMTYYNKDETSKGQRLHGAFVGLLDHIENTKPLIQNISEFAPEYDFDENTVGNGYRSFLYISESSIKHSIKICRYIKENRSSLLFRKGIYMKEIEACNHLIASICTCLNLLFIIRDWCNQGELFTIVNHAPYELFSKTEPINQYAFYGRCIGFQYCESIRTFLKFFSICMAGFSEAYYTNGGKLAKATNSMWTSGKYYMDPELRARRVVNVIRNANVNFCKSFWFLAESELMQKIPSIMGAQLKINKVVVIYPEPLEIVNVNTGEFVNIPIPFSHVGTKPIYGRLLSVTRRDGMDADASCRRRSSREMTNKLIFHIHGGGFVAQSSKSHESYLREWTSKLNIPIFSIDYSLAPKAPFPRALEEVFYAYCWTVKNAEALGTTETIILAGDSAGANLCFSLTIKIIENGIRKPDGIFAAYCPILLSLNISPARLLCMIDPLLPFGFLMRCVQAYVIGNDNNETSEQEISETTPTIENVNNIIKSNSINLKSQLPVVDEAKEQEEIGQNNGGETVSDNSDSFEENSVWEHIQASESDLQHLQAHKSPVSDATSDTLAGASFRSQTGGGMDVLTPDDMNGISLEEDGSDICDAQSKTSVQQIPDSEDEMYGPLTAAEVLELDPVAGTDMEQKSNQYVSDFIDRYVLDTTIDSDGNTHPILRGVSRTQSEENIVFDIGREAVTVKNIQEKIQKVAENFATAVTSTINTMTQTNSVRESPSPNENPIFSNAPTENDIFIELGFEVPNDPYISPYLASDDVLKQMPKIQLFTAYMDPCLDDCVMFAKKLKKVGVPVGLDIINGLPHGFLNFSLLSKEANLASKLCMKRISELFDIDFETVVIINDK